MTRLASLVLSALLSGLVHSVDAKSKADQVRMYQFTSDYCDGMPKGGNFDLKRNDCVNVDGRSFKPRMDKNRAGWLNDVNHGATQCALALFTEPQCNEDNRFDIMAFPEEMDNCFTSPTGFAIRSVKFFCGQSIIAYNTTSVRTTTLSATSWSVGKDDVVTPHSYEETFTVTTEFPLTSTTSFDVVRRNAEEVAVKENVQGVWMKHPWSGSTICYECFTKKKDDFGWVKCLSKANEDWNCGPRPVGPGGEPLTTTTTEMASTTTTVTESTVDSGTKIFTTTTTEAGTIPSPLPSPSTQDLQPRSWHKKVTFNLPWQNGFIQMCADAEWEKRGKPNSEIRLQDVHRLDGKKHNCEEDISLDLPARVLETATDATVMTDTTTLHGYTAAATYTTTIYTAVFVSTSTLSAETGFPGATTTMWPSVFTVTTMMPTEVTITSMVPSGSTTTIYPDNERDGVPAHRDL